MKATQPMNKVNTTLGELNPNDLGRVNVHEHVIINVENNSRIPKDFHHVETEKIASELILWKESGGGVIIDSSPISVGRDITLLEKTSQAAALPLIATSGFHKLSYYPNNHWIFSASKEEIYQILLGELTQGILMDDRNPYKTPRSKIKAGILKIGVDLNGITPTLEKIISAVGRAMDQTNVNCMIHTETGVPFEEMLRNLDKNKIPPKQTIFCHMGKSLDSGIHQLLAREGYYLEFDEMIRPNPPISELARAILKLVQHDYGQSILFAGDLARRSYWSCFDGKPGLQYLMTGLENDLINLKFTEDLLGNIWQKNPQRFFDSG